MKIEVGQIWGYGISRTIFVITRFLTDGYVCTVSDDGETSRAMKTNHIEAGCIFIASYPTWQEAVNSFEFRGN